MNDFYVTGAEREEPDTKSELIQAGEARFLCPDISHICISPPLPPSRDYFIDGGGLNLAGERGAEQGGVRGGRESGAGDHISHLPVRGITVRERRGSGPLGAVPHGHRHDHAVSGDL